MAATPVASAVVAIRITASRSRRRPRLEQRDAGARHTRQRVDAAQHLTVVGVVVDVRVGTGRAASGYATKTLPLRSMPVSSAWSSDRLRISAAVARSTSDIASCVATMSRRYGWCGSSSVRRHEWLRRPCLACRARRARVHSTPATTAAAVVSATTRPSGPPLNTVGTRNSANTTRTIAVQARCDSRIPPTAPASESGHLR